MKQLTLNRRWFGGNQGRATKYATEISDEGMVYQFCPLTLSSGELTNHNVSLPNHVSSTQLFAIAVSFASVNSLISLPCAMSNASIPVSLKQTFALPVDVVRTSVGREDVDDLIEDLERAFAIASRLYPGQAIW